MVQPGDSISALAKQFYGADNLTILHYIMQKNPEIVHPHKIRVNQKITLPAITYESAVLKFPGGVYRIWLGKFLSPEEAESLKEDPVLKGGEIEVIPQKFPRVLLGTGSCGASFTP